MAQSSRYGYQRLSKDRTLRGINVEIQHEEIDDYAEQSGESIAKHLSDNDKSASEFGTKPRKGYIELLGDIRNGLVAEIIVTEVPRLCRQSEEGEQLIKLSKTTPLRYISTTDGMVYDLATPRGRKNFRDAVSDAQFESDQSSSRQHRKKNKQAEAGMFHGGQRPYGYEGAIYEYFTTASGEQVRGPLLNPGRVGRTIVEAEAAVIRECVKRIISGEREFDLVRDLNKRAIKTAEGGQWRIGNLKKLLLKKRYVQWPDSDRGTRVHHGREYQAVWPYLISREDRELMAAAFRLHAASRPNGYPAGRTYLLSGIVRCGRCGKPMYGKGRTLRSGQRQRRYCCLNQNLHGAQDGCGKVTRGADPLELLAKEAVIFRFDSPAVAAALAPKEDQALVRELVDRHGQQTLHLKSLVADYGTGLLSRDELAIAKAAAQAAIDDTEAALAKVQTTKAVAQVPAGMTIREAWDRGSMDWRRRLVLLLVDHIDVLPGHPGTRQWNGWRFDPTKIDFIWKH